MKLKALTIGLALSFPMLASAQSDTSVTLYGNIDTAIEYVNNIQNPINGDKNSSFHFTNLTQSWPSYWGLRGKEKISDNLSALFTLESGFNAGTGTSGQGGRFFGREAWVGLKGDWGQVAFGRQYNMLSIGLRGADIMGPNAYGLGSIDTYIPNARTDNAITYQGNFSGFKLGLAYAKGRDTLSSGGGIPGVGSPAATGCGVNFAEGNSACTAYSAMLGYDAANWGVAAAYDVIKGAGLGANYYGLREGDKDRRWMANGYVKFDALKVGLIYMNRKSDGLIGIGNTSNPILGTGGSLGNRSDLWTLNAAFAVTPAVTIDGSVNYINYKDASDSSKAWYYVARAKYSLSKRTSVYVSAAYMKNKGNSALSAAGGTVGAGPGAGNNQTAVMTGLRHSF